ncbi:MAG: portal protein, partial [Candidatus Paceibacterota bacterium]
EYFEKKLYKSLGIPFSRSQQGTGFSLGRTTEITRDELKFSKMIDRLRGKFSGLFDGLLKNQLILKKIIAEEDWDEIKEELFYQFLKDNNFEELKEAELNMSRVGLLGTVDPFVGRYYSVDWVKKNILRQTDEEIEEMKEQMEEEQEEMLKNMPKDADGNPLPVDPNTGLPMGQQQDQGQEQQLPAGEEQRQPDPKRKRRFQMSGEDISAMN